MIFGDDPDRFNETCFVITRAQGIFTSDTYISRRCPTYLFLYSLIETSLYFLSIALFQFWRQIEEATQFYLYSPLFTVCLIGLYTALFVHGSV